MSKSSGYDRHITIFSPEGRLYQVEYALKAVKSAGFTTIGLRGEDSVVVLTQKKLPDKLMDKDYTTHLYNITPNIGCACTGMSADSRAVVFKAREIAAKFKDENGYEIPVQHLALKVANNGQMYTQHAYMRPYGCNMIFSAMDDENGPSLFMVDPSGFFMGYKAAAAGAKDQEANNALEKLLKKNNKLTEQTTIRQAIACLQAVMGMDFKPSDIEVAVVSKSRVGFQRLSEAEVDNHLNAIAEMD